MNATTTTVISIFLLLVAGYTIKRFGVLNSDDVKVVNSILINLCLPAFILVNTNMKPFKPEMFTSIVVGIFLELVVMGIAFLIGRSLKLERPLIGGMMLVAVFGNTGFMGYPVIKAAFNGNDVGILSAVMLDNFMMAITLNTVGIAVASSFSGAKFHWGQSLSFFKTPLFPVTIIALLLRKTPMPDIVLQTAGHLAAGTIPLAMISIGLSLSVGALRQYTLPIIASIILKMAILPALMATTLYFIGVQGIVRQVAILECAMPTAVFAGVVAGEFGKCRQFAASTIFLSTMLSVISIPIVISLIS